MKKITIVIVAAIIAAVLLAAAGCSGNQLRLSYSTQRGNVISNGVARANSQVTVWVTVTGVRGFGAENRDVFEWSVVSTDIEDVEITFHEYLTNRIYMRAPAPGHIRFLVRHYIMQRDGETAFAREIERGINVIS